MEDWEQKEKTIKALIISVDLCYEERLESMKNGKEGAKKLGLEMGVDIDKILSDQGPPGMYVLKEYRDA